MRPHPPWRPNMPRCQQSPPPQVLGSVMDKLREVRDEYVWLGEDPIYFYTRVLGGKWTKEHDGKAADGCSGLARSDEPQAWCVQYGCPRQSGLMFSKFGREAANELARDSGRRGEFFDRLFLECGAEYFEYNVGHLTSMCVLSRWLGSTSCPASM